MPENHTDSKPGFTPQPMVGWYDAKQLAQTGIKAVISSIFGSYADKRETLASISDKRVDDFSSPDGLWLDYISDLGDGFDSTYSMATLVAAPQLQVKGLDMPLPKGKVIVLGGDQVYPTANREEYENRFSGPYEAAFPRDRNKPIEHYMYAVPGNHDWYDGLTSFSKLFFQERTIGNWQTKQNRSYFAMKVSQHTWLWAIDIQLEADIDQPQLGYFDWVIKTYMAEGDKVILCSAEPSWIYSNNRRGDRSYKNLLFFESEFIEKRGLNLIISLAGDLHHYARYVKQGSESNSQKFTAGGGGAFLHPTHNLPGKLTGLREGDFDLKTTFPPRAVSKRMLLGNIWFPFKNWQFGTFVATIYLLFAWITDIVSRIGGYDLMKTLKTCGTGEWYKATKLFLGSLSYSPPSIIIILALVFGLGAFCDTASSKNRWVGIIGYLHGACHVLLICLMLWGFAYFNHNILFPFINDHWNMVIHPDHDRNWMTVFVLLEMFVIGGYLASVLMGTYLMIANWLFKIHDNEAFSSLKNGHWKNFLRLHIQQDKITIYPIGVRKTATWNKNSVPFKTKNTLAPELIEAPVVIPLN